MKKIAVITGTRAEYGYTRRILKLIENDSNLDYALIVTGMHLLEQHGLSYKEIEKDGFKIAYKVKMGVSGGSPEEHAKSIGTGISKMAEIYGKIKPDMVLIAGDPWEMFVAAVAAVFINIPIAHIQSGEVSGNIDGITRHAITKLSHIHFAANSDAAKRVERMGEEKFRIFTVGAPLLDKVVEVVRYGGIDANTLATELNFDLKRPIIVVLQHPVSIEWEHAGQQMRETMKAIENLKFQTVVIYPNNEPGSSEMIRVIKKYKSKEYIRIFENLPRIKYLSLLRIAAVLVGNSSSGILEAPSFKLPVINIGNRECGRLRACNVMDVPYESNEILKAIKRALYNKKFRKAIEKCVNPYGDGNSSKRIVKILGKIEIDKKLLDKKMAY